MTGFLVTALAMTALMLVVANLPLSRPEQSTGLGSAVIAALALGFVTAGLVMRLADRRAPRPPALARDDGAPRTSARFADFRTPAEVAPPRPAASNSLSALREALAQPLPRASSGSGLLIGSMALYFLVGMQGTSVAAVALLIAVLVIHEGGHLLGMTLFGYQDLRVFFLPLFGAAATGRKPGAPVWQRSIVLLLGPLPGLLAADVLLAQGAEGMTRKLALSMLFLNAINLLPFAPLDGGQLLQLLLFLRSRWLEGAFTVASALALAALGALKASWPFVLVAGVMLLTLSMRFRWASAAHQLRGRFAILPGRAEDLTEEQLACVLSTARPPRLSTEAEWPLARRVAAVRAIHERATLTPSSLPVTVALLAIYTSGWMTALLCAKR